MRSKFYKSWRAYESGSTASMRSRLLVSLSFWDRSAAPAVVSASQEDDVGCIDGSYRSDPSIDCSGYERSVWCEKFVDDNNVVDIIGDMQNFIGGTVGDLLGDDPNCSFKISCTEDVTTSEIVNYCANDDAHDVASPTFGIRTSTCRAVSLETTLSISCLRSADSQQPGIKSKPPVIPWLLSNEQKDMLTESFAEAAFSSASDDPQDMVLLLGSTWLAMLVAGVESVSIGFSLLSVPCNNRRVTLTEVTNQLRPNSDTQHDGCNDFRFVYLNRQFERDFGFSKQELVGRSIRSLFCSTAENNIVDNHSRCSYSNAESALLRLLRSGINGPHALPLRRRNGRSTRTFICTKALYDQRGVFRYIVCMTVNVPANCGIMYRNLMLPLDDMHLATSIAVDNRAVGPLMGALANPGNSNNIDGSSVSKSPHSAPELVDVDSSRFNRASNHRQQVDIVTQFNSDALVELLDVLPTVFDDDGDADD